MATAETTTITDPPIGLWFDAERKRKLKDELLSAFPVLLISGRLNDVLDYWIRKELSRDMLSNVRAWPISQQDSDFDEALQSWRSKSSSIQDLYTEDLLKVKLFVNPGSLRWARCQWEKRLETFFLEHKFSLDSASFWLLRVSTQNLANELFYRLIAEEESFQSMVGKYGNESDKKRGGFWPMQPFSNLPKGLPEHLAKLETGQVPRPIKVGKDYFLIKLVKKNQARLDATTEKKLLMIELNRWIASAIPTATDYLMSCQAK